MNAQRTYKPVVRYGDLEGAYLFVSAAGSIDAAAYVCRESGTIYWESDDFGDESEVPENVGDTKKFAQVPNQYELDLGKALVFRFMREFLPEHYEQVTGLFRRKGAYARFKDYLFNLGKLEDWYAFENSATEKALRSWAEEEGFAFEPGIQQETKRIYQFRVELKGLEPIIWRRVQVPETYSFWDLHVAIQDAMGWLDCHPHAFRLVDEEGGSAIVIGIPDEFESPDARTLPSWETPLVAHFRDLGSTAEYEYDFGDGWLHRIVLEGMLLAEPGVPYPACVDGERACPPEDCGGVHGYEQLLSALKSPEQQRPRGLLHWVQRAFDPDRFDPADVEFDDPRQRWEDAFRQ